MVRVEGDFSSNDIKGKIKSAELSKVHTMLVIGGREQESDKVTLRVHGKGNLGAKSRKEAISELVENIRLRKS